jgi:sugar phosphate isomerase/epimerase
MKCISFATGNLYRFHGKINVLELIDSLGVEGIEYTYGKTFVERPINERDVNILLKQKDVSLHSPFKFFKKPETFSADETDLQKIIFDYARINAKRFVVHPENRVPRDLIQQAEREGVQFVTENMRKRHGNEKKPNHERKEFEYDLNNHRKWGLCLDVSHAYSWGPKEISKIIDSWKDRIMQVHFSVTHYTVTHFGIEKASNKFLDSIKPIKTLDVPIVIEEDMRTLDTMWIKAEIERVKKVIGAD